MRDSTFGATSIHFEAPFRCGLFDLVLARVGSNRLGQLRLQRWSALDVVLARVQRLLFRTQRLDGGAFDLIAHLRPASGSRSLLDRHRSLRATSMPGAPGLARSVGHRRSAPPERWLHFAALMPGNHKSLANLAEHVRALPLTDQLTLLRMIAPTIVAELDEQERAVLVYEINQAIARHATTAR